MFLITLSIPIFYVSVFSTIQSHLGLKLDSFSVSSPLASFETATGHLGPSQNAKYSPGTGGQICSFTSKTQLNDGAVLPQEMID